MFWTIAISATATFLLGVLAMNFATPEKKLERKINHRYAVSDPQFRREMSVLLGPSITAGNHVWALQNGAEIFPAMLEAIRGARTSVTFETYIYWSGEVGEEFTAALSERARADVPVTVTVDWAGSVGMDWDLLGRMEEAGVRVQRYRPLRWYNLGRFNNRTHRKLLVVDGRVGFTGGVGIADQWQGEARDPSEWRDMHFRIDGPAVAQFQAAFNDNWIETTGEVLNGATYFPRLEPAGAMDAHLFMAVAAAERTIDLAAAYFVPDDLLIGAMVAARERGVRVRILLPGPHIDSETVRISSKGEWGPLLQAGVEIHVYQPTMMHSKLLVIDNEMVSVGSTNFDLRSLRLNDEASLNVYDVAFARQMAEVFEADLRASKRYTFETWKNRPLREKLMEKFLLPIKSQL